MKFEKVRKIIEILEFINEKEKCSAKDIIDKFKINKKTLYKFIDKWDEEGIVNKKEILKNGKNGIRFVICSTLILKTYFNKPSDTLSETSKNNLLSLDVEEKIDKASVKLLNILKNYTSKVLEKGHDKELLFETLRKIRFALENELKKKNIIRNYFKNDSGKNSEDKT